MKDKLAEKRTDERGIWYWFKEVSKRQWDPKSYKEFYEGYGGDFLPKLIEYNSEPDTPYITMEYIDGEQIKPAQYPMVMQFACYRVIPAFYRYSMSAVAGISTQELIDGFMNQSRNCRLYFHTDLKFSNFIITKQNKIYLLDIDSLNWESNQYLETKLLYLNPQAEPDKE